MQLEDFYSAVLPSEGHYALWEKATKRHVWCESVAELVEQSEHTLTSPDWYYATASFSGPSPDGKFKRTQDFVQGKKCFYIDIDAGPEKYAKHGDKVYATFPEAVTAIAAFAKKTGLKPSFVVASGAGLHVYWVLEETLPEWEWRGDAERFKKVTRVEGIRADDACTADSARVLRPLGSKHGNGNTVTLLRDTGKVWTIAEFREKVSAIVGQDFLTSAPPINQRKLGDLTEYSSVPLDFRRVALGCMAMKEACHERGAHASEPMWRAFLSVAKISAGGRDIAHKYSAGHRDYTPDATDEKYDRYQAGPMTCATIEGYTDACSRCKHYGKITSPAQLGRLHDEPLPKPAVDEPAAELPEQAKEENLLPAGVLPAGFLVQYEGAQPTLKRIVRQQQMVDGKKSGQWEEIIADVSQDIFWFNGWMDNDGIQGTEYTLFIKRNKAQPPQAHTLTGGSLGSTTEALKTLADKGIRPDWRSEDAIKHMSKYVEAQLARIKRESSRPVVRNHYGFRMETVDGETAMTCAHGPYMIRKDGIIRKALVASSLAAAGAQFGIAKLPDNEDLEWDANVWADIIYPSAEVQANFYRQHHTTGHEMLQLVIALHMASPMLLFAAENDWSGGPLPANGFTVSLYSSRSGVGKSAAMKAAAAAWGNANSLVPAGSKHDMTPNAMVARIASHGTMAFAADEVTQNGPAETANLINVVAGGQTKHRANKTGGISGTQSTWSLISILSSNTRQREMLAIAQSQSNALQMRMIELDCDKLRRVDARTSQAYEEARNSQLHANYGALGALLNYYCVQRGYEEMRKRGVAALAKAREVLPNAQEGRFFCRALAAVYMLQDALAELKLTIFETPALQEQFYDAYINSINSARELTMTSVDRVREYIRANLRSIITTDNLRATDSPIRDRMLGTTPTEVVGRNILATGVTYLALRPFSKWCVTEGASATTIIGDLASDGRLMMTERMGSESYAHQINLTQGLEMTPVVQDCILVRASLEAFAKTPKNVTKLKTENSNGSSTSSESNAPSGATAGRG